MNGVVNLLKPTGMTSSDAVVVLRRILGVKKAGHAGTLDPFAAGVLPVMVGRATRVFDALCDQPKTYLAEFALGVGTDTLDADGLVTRRDEGVQVAPEAWERALSAFRGVITQRPPLYSAVHVDGRRLYDLARRNIKAEAPPRQVTVYRFDTLRQPAPNRFVARVVCSRGTYIRSLCDDVAAALGTCGHLACLLRTGYGPYTLEDAFTLEEAEHQRRSGRLAELLTPADRPLSGYPALSVAAQDAAALCAGRTVEAVASAGQVYRVYGPGGFLGLGEGGESGASLRLKTLLCQDDAP